MSKTKVTSSFTWKNKDKAKKIESKVLHVGRNIKTDLEFLHEDYCTLVCGSRNQHTEACEYLCSQYDFDKA